MRKDINFVDAWQWWRAHRVALITTDGKLLVGEKKEMLSPAVMARAYKTR